MTQKEKYHFRKEQGLCVRCGKNKAEEGRVLCNNCKAKQSEYYNETRQFFKDLGLCTRCHKNRIFENETLCPECRARRMDYNEKFIRENPEKVRATHGLVYRKRRERLKKQGLCTACGKRPAVEGKCRCQICLEKKRNAIKKGA